MQENPATPYATLSPDLILDAIENIGYPCTGGLFALNSYENRVYQVEIEDALPLIVKFYRPQRWSDEIILEEHQFAQELSEHEVPVIAPYANALQQTLHHFQDFRFAVFPKQRGHAFELDNMQHLEWLGRFIGRLHAIGATRSFLYRPQLSIESYARTPFAFLHDNNFIPHEIKTLFSEKVTAVLEKITTIFSRVGSITHLRLHGDCHAGNILWNDNGPHIVDLDDCLTGPAIQDLWMLLSGDEESMRFQMQVILQGYEDFFEFDYREIHLIEALRTLRMIHYCGWLAKRWNDPTFPKNFPWFNTVHYWQDLLKNLTDQDSLLAKVLVKFD